MARPGQNCSTATQSSRDSARTSRLELAAATVGPFEVCMSVCESGRWWPRASAEVGTGNESGSHNVGAISDGGRGDRTSLTARLVSSLPTGSFEPFRLI